MYKTAAAEAATAIGWHTISIASARRGAAAPVLIASRDALPRVHTRLAYERAPEVTRAKGIAGVFVGGRIAEQHRPSPRERQVVKRDALLVLLRARPSPK